MSAHQFELAGIGGEPVRLADHAGKPVLVVMHGLNGSSDEDYVVEVVNKALREGMSAMVMIARGLGGMQHLCGNGKFFCKARTSDLALALRTAHAALNNDTEQPEVPLVAVGFSMGGSVLANYLTQSGAATPLRAAVIISGTKSS